MTTADYIDWDEGRDFPADASFSEAVLTCENCKAHADRLTRVPEWDYMGCDDCMEEALAVLEREQIERKPVAPSQFTFVERWTGEKWIEVRLEWNGTEYKEAA